MNHVGHAGDQKESMLAIHVCCNCVDSVCIIDIAFCHFRDCDWFSTRTRDGEAMRGMKKRRLGKRVMLCLRKLSISHPSVFFN